MKTITIILYKIKQAMPPISTNETPRHPRAAVTYFTLQLLTFKILN